MSVAIIRTGGKQYLVEKGTKLKVEKLKGKEGDKVTFDEILCFADGTGKECLLGTPVLSGVSVSGTIRTQGRSKKVVVIKYKNKIRYKRTRGHRQSQTAVEITSITKKKG